MKPTQFWGTFSRVFTQKMVLRSIWGAVVQFPRETFDLTKKGVVRILSNLWHEGSRSADQPVSLDVEVLGPRILPTVVPTQVTNGDPAMEAQMASAQSDETDSAGASDSQTGVSQYLRQQTVLSEEEYEAAGADLTSAIAELTSSKNELSQARTQLTADVEALEVNLVTQLQSLEDRTNASKTREQEIEALQEELDGLLVNESSLQDSLNTSRTALQELQNRLPQLESEQQQWQTIAEALPAKIAEQQAIIERSQRVIEDYQATLDPAELSVSGNSFATSLTIQTDRAVDAWKLIFRSQSGEVIGPEFVFASGELPVPVTSSFEWVNLEVSFNGHTIQQVTPSSIPITNGMTFTPVSVQAQVRNDSDRPPEVIQAEQDLATATQKEKELQAELEESQTKVSQLASNINATQQQIENLSSHITEKQNDLVELQDEIQKKSTDLEAARQQLTSLHEVIAQLDHDIGEGERELAEKRDLLELNHDQLRQVEQNLTAKVREQNVLALRSPDTKTRLGALTQLDRELQQDREVSAQQLAEVEADLAEVQTQLSTMPTLDQLENDVSNAHFSVLGFTSTLATAEAELTQLQSQRQNLIEQIDERSAEITDAETEMEQLQQQLQTDQAELESVRLAIPEQETLRDQAKMILDRAAEEASTEAQRPAARLNVTAEKYDDEVEISYVHFLAGYRLQLQGVTMYEHPFSADSGSLTIQLSDHFSWDRQEVRVVVIREIDGREVSEPITFSMFAQKVWSNPEGQQHQELDKTLVRPPGLLSPEEIQEAEVQKSQAEEALNALQTKSETLTTTIEQNELALNNLQTRTDELVQLRDETQSSLSQLENGALLEAQEDLVAAQTALDQTKAQLAALEEQLELGLELANTAAQFQYQCDQAQAVLSQADRDISYVQDRLDSARQELRHQLLENLRQDLLPIPAVTGETSAGILATHQHKQDVLQQNVDLLEAARTDWITRRQEAVERLSGSSESERIIAEVEVQVFDEILTSIDDVILDYKQERIGKPRLHVEIVEINLQRLRIRIRYATPEDRSRIELSTGGGSAIIHHVGGTEERSLTLDVPRNAWFGGYQNTDVRLMGEDMETVLDVVGLHYRHAGEVSFTTRQRDWDDLEPGLLVDAPIQPAIHFVRAEGPNVLLQIQSPHESSHVYIDKAGGLLSSLSLKHDIGTPLSFVNLTMPAKSPSGTYTVVLNSSSGEAASTLQIGWNNGSKTVFATEQTRHWSPTRYLEQLDRLASSNPLSRDLGQAILEELDLEAAYIAAENLVEAEIDGMLRVESISLSDPFLQRVQKIRLLEQTDLAMSHEEFYQLFVRRYPHWESDDTARARVAEEWERSNKTFSLGSLQDTEIRTRHEVLGALEEEWRIYNESMGEYFSRAIHVLADVRLGQEENYFYVDEYEALYGRAPKLKGIRSLGAPWPTRNEIVKIARDVYLREDTQALFAHFQSEDDRLQKKERNQAERMVQAHIQAIEDRRLAQSAALDESYRLAQESGKSVTPEQAKLNQQAYLERVEALRDGRLQEEEAQRLSDRRIQRNLRLVQTALRAGAHPTVRVILSEGESELVRSARRGQDGVIEIPVTEAELLQMEEQLVRALQDHADDPEVAGEEMVVEVEKVADPLVGLVVTRRTGDGNFISLTHVGENAWHINKSSAVAAGDEFDPLQYLFSATLTSRELVDLNFGDEITDRLQDWNPGELNALRDAFADVAHHEEIRQQVSITFTALLPETGGYNQKALMQILAESDFEVPALEGSFDQVLQVLDVGIDQVKAEFLALTGEQGFFQLKHVLLVVRNTDKTLEEAFVEGFGERAEDVKKLFGKSISSENARTDLYKSFTGGVVLDLALNRLLGERVELPMIANAAVPIAELLIGSGIRKLLPKLAPRAAKLLAFTFVGVAIELAQPTQGGEPDFEPHVMRLGNSLALTNFTIATRLTPALRDGDAEQLADLMRENVHYYRSLVEDGLLSVEQKSEQTLLLSRFFEDEIKKFVPFTLTVADVLQGEIGVENPFDPPLSPVDDADTDYPN